MTEEVFDFRIIVEKPVAGAIYGVQKGSGNTYETLQKQTASSAALTFDIALPAKRTKEGNLILYGPFCQGPPHERFLYLDIGSYAGQENAPFSGRLKIPLPKLSDAFSSESIIGRTLVATVYGTNETTGRPVGGTVKPVDGWKTDRR
ncbi:DUF5990 family protein [Fibrella sp. WM1]|uniref:DUF5990 family protein n=1 Tax=Fibrella musci TaxID=3242485 RepID=UPI00351FDBE8